MTGTDWKAVEERCRRAEKALRYMREHPVSREEARAQSERLKKWKN